MARRFGERELEQPAAKRTSLFGRKMLGFMFIYLVLWLGTNMLFPKEWTIHAEPDALFSTKAQEQVTKKTGTEAPLYIQGFTFDLGDGSGFREALSFGAVPYEQRDANTYRAWYVSYDAKMSKPYQLHKINQEFKMDSPPVYSMDGAYQVMERVSGQLRALYDAVPAPLREGASAVFLSTASASAYSDGSGGAAPVSGQAVTITLSDTLEVSPGVRQQSWNEKTLYLYSSYPVPAKEGEKSPETRTELVAAVELPPG